MCHKTLHTNTRAQQRGIPPLIIDLLLKFGVRERDGRGAEICYFDNKSKKKIQTYAGGLLGKLSEELNAYAVVEGETIITVGTRYKRINHL
jgi:hypothetical protein